MSKSYTSIMNIMKYYMKILKILEELIWQVD